MKKLILYAMLPMIMLSFSSCLRDYTCQCDDGSTIEMQAATKRDAKRGCEAISSGTCTL